MPSFRIPQCILTSLILLRLLNKTISSDGKVKKKILSDKTGIRVGERLKYNFVASLDR
jgi:hypothetical protein